MSEVKAGLHYSESHEWLQELGQDIVLVGISAHASELLGDVVYVELPKIGTSFKAGDSIGVVESVKAASDIYAPASGEVIEINTQLEGAPELINQDPYGTGWLFKLKLTQALPTLMNQDAYQKAIQG